MNKIYRNLTILIVALVMLNIGCSDTSGPVKRSWGRMKGLEKLVGNMEDTSYSYTRSMKSRLNALGQPTSMAQFEGQFIWAEYVASWCMTCAKQTPQVQIIKKEFEREITFLTIMTAKSPSYEDHATINTAMDWAKRYNLNPARVLVAENLWSKMIPEHRFFSPKGHTLFVHVGFLSASQIRKIINYYKEDWDQWSETNQPATWINFEK